MSGEHWKDICPELFALVLKAVQENSEEEGEGRRIVALAGVCRRWRQLIRQSYVSPLGERGVVQFPFALKKAGPRHRPVQCFLKRKRNLLTLFQDNGGNGEKLDFLMAAQRKWKPSGSSFVISAHPKCFSKTGHEYMGKLKSNFFASEFFLWEQSADDGKLNLVTHVNFSERTEHACRQRTISCELFQGPTKSEETHRSNRSFPSELVDNSMRLLLQWSCLRSPLPESPKRKASSTFFRSYSSLRRSGKILDRNNSKKNPSSSVTPSNSRRWRGTTPDSLVMESKAPEWDEQRECWSLDFHGRSTLPSIYSFQLVAAAHPEQQESAETEPQEETIFLQMGKVGKGLYTVDFCHPLSAFQAFAICLSSFATSVGLEP